MNTLYIDMSVEVSLLHSYSRAKKEGEVRRRDVTFPLSPLLRGSNLDSGNFICTLHSGTLPYTTLHYPTKSAETVRQ